MPEDDVPASPEEIRDHIMYIVENRYMGLYAYEDDLSLSNDLAKEAATYVFDIMGLSMVVDTTLLELVDNTIDETPEVVDEILADFHRNR